MKTKRINIFDETPRKIMCIKKTYDYFGDDTLFTEDKLEIGKLYSLEKTSLEPYGKMVFLKEMKNKYGFQDFLFEELEEHDLKTYEQNYENWLLHILDKSLEDTKLGKVKDATEVFNLLKENLKNKTKGKFDGYKIQSNKRRNDITVK